MKTKLLSLGILAVALAAAAPSQAQLARTNAIWARKAPNGSITLDGNLNEAVWAQAQSWRVHYGYDQAHPVTGTQGIIGSGWKDEGGFPPGQFATNDSTNATIKFLVVGNVLYMGATVPDKSIGGGGGFNYFDGLLMGLKDHLAPGFPKPINEYLYSWWYPREASMVSPCAQAIDSAVGNPPIFKGRWAPDPVCDEVTGQVKPRTAEQIAAWDARVVTVGTTNNDNNGVDGGYTIEMKFDLAVMGYDVTDSDGDILEWNISIYDTDNWWRTPLGFDLSRNRTWWQNPWGRDMFHDEVRIYGRNDVTTTSGALPPFAPDFTIPNANAAAAPTINGTPNEAVWASATSFDVRWADDVLRASYPNIGKWRSGEFQPDVGGGKAFVADGGDATVKAIVKGDWLYMAFDVRDLFVQNYAAIEDRWDGFNVSITHRTETDPEDHNSQGKALAFVVGPGGVAAAQKDLPPLITAGTAQVAIALKAGTVVDTTGTVGGNCNNGPQIDTGYTAELAVNLTALGYPTGLGDRTMFLGITLFDGDSFCNNSDSYATKTWWYREREESCCPAWTLISAGTVDVAEDGPFNANGFAALGNAPNPFRLFTNLDFALGRESDVAIEIFDLAGRLVSRQTLGRFAAGRQQAVVRMPEGKSGLFLYRIKAQDPASGNVVASMSGKMMHLR